MTTKLNHVIYDWIPDKGKDAAMTSAHERYEGKHEELANGNYLQIQRELNLLATNDAANAKTLTARYSRRGLFRRRTPVPGALANVSSDTVVVIIAHGSDKRAAIGYVIKKTRHEISAADLATMLEMDGLRKGHRFIKLNSCYAAGGADCELNDTFAQLLAQQLGRLGYEQIAVGGYENSLVSPASHTDKKTSSYDKVTEKPLDDGRSVQERTLVSQDASGGRTWYDKDGNAVHTGKLSDFIDAG